MQPIILLGVAVAAVALVSTGFLQTTAWNEFDLWVQQLGWGTNTIDSPITKATIDLEIKKTLVINGENGDFYKNSINRCSFHSFSTIDPVANFPGASDGVIICKILGEDGNAIAEGRVAIDLATGYVGSTTLAGEGPINPGILIDMCAQGPSPNDSDPGCLDVMANIHGVKVVVEAPVGEALPGTG